MAVPVTFVSSHSASGGSEAYLFRLIEELGPEWVNDVVCLQEGPLVERLRTAGHRVTVIEVPARPPGLITRSFALRRHLRSTSASIVHANGIKAAFACALAAANTRIRVVWVKHDFSFEGLFASSVGMKTDRIVGVSVAVISKLRGRVARKATAVHTGVDHEDIDRAAARRDLLAEAGWSEDSFVVGAVGRLDPAKGYRELLRAAAIAREQIPTLRVAIVGTVDANHPNEQERIERTAREQALPDVKIFGTREDIRRTIAAFDVGVIPTIATRHGGREGFSLVALEMLDAGTPVVAFASGALPEVVGPCGVLVTEGSIDQLGAAIASVAEDRGRAERLAACGRERVARDFTTDRWIEQMKSEYEALSKL